MALTGPRFLESFNGEPHLVLESTRVIPRLSPWPAVASIVIAFAFPAVYSLWIRGSVALFAISSCSALVSTVTVSVALAARRTIVITSRGVHLLTVAFEGSCKCDLVEPKDVRDVTVRRQLSTTKRYSATLQLRRSLLTPFGTADIPPLAMDSQDESAVLARARTAADLLGVPLNITYPTQTNTGSLAAAGEQMTAQNAG